MLVLSREQGESIVIGQDIVIHVVKIARGRVRIGIIAPDDVPVDRAEVWIEKNKSKQGGSK